MGITEVTRRNIIDCLLLRKESFHGRLDLVSFLRRIWDLSSMPSTDVRFKNAEGDIWQHMINNDDWDYNYLLYTYLGLLGCNDETFLKFLETCLHPIVLTDGKQVSELLSEFNGYLEPDEYKLEEVTLWGKDLTEHLDKVYRGSARYCVMFISKHYAEKIWASHEKRSALAKAIQEKEEYILPARFDNTEIKGVQPTIGCVDLTKKTPEELGEMILQKLGRK